MGRRGEWEMGRWGDGEMGRFLEGPVFGFVSHGDDHGNDMVVFVMEEGVCFFVDIVAG